MASCSILPGIMKLFLYDVTDSPLEYFILNDEIVLSGNTIFDEFLFEKCTFTQNRTTDAKGVYYAQKFDLSVLDFNEESVFDLEGKTFVVVFEDGEGNRFITGFENGYSLDKEDATNADDANNIAFSLVQDSYMSFKTLGSNTLINYIFYFGTASGSRPTASAGLVTGGTVLTSSSVNFTIDFQASGEYIWIAYPTSIGVKTHWAVSPINQGDIGGTVNIGGNLFPDGDAITINGVQYTVHISNYPTTTFGGMTIS